MITDQLAKKLKPADGGGTRVLYDGAGGIPGFGLRVTASGAKSFVLNYRFRNRERRLTIGSYGQNLLTVAGARKRAGELRRQIDNGIDPLAEKIEARDAPTVADLAERFVEEHLPKLRPSSRVGYRAIISNDILPALKHHKVVAVSYTDIDALHRRITKRGAKYAANRAVAAASKMFSLSIRWGWRTDNPARGIERNQEVKRRRYLSADELARLTKALATHEDQQAANIIRLLLLTGARRGEILSMRWADIDLDAGLWVKPGSATKQKTEHRVPLSDAAMTLIKGLRDDETAEFVFPGAGGTGHRVELKKDWAALCKAAGISGARLHDLRHSFASILASAGMSLPVIGALLGHSQVSTTQRYAHLFDDPLRAATERASEIIGGKPSAEIVTLRKGA